MRRFPLANYLRGSPQSLASPSAKVPPNTPETQGDAIEPFIVGGGKTFFPTGFIEGPTPEPSGVQLLATQYVPVGRAAWVKRIEVAPCAPPVLVDPWRGWGGFFNLFEASPAPYGNVQRAPAQAGLWETPLAWEGYFTPDNPPPVWRWLVTLFPGDVARERYDRAIGPFDPGDPSTWYLVPDWPVPLAPTYGIPGAIPGKEVNGYVSVQRFQAVPGAALPVHILCPENHTICLWAQWEQAPIDPLLAFGPSGPFQPWDIEASPLPPVWPILPSVGRMAGYMQAATRESAAVNAQHGWGG
jgi:hypothetical protein